MAQINFLFLNYVTNKDILNNLFLFKILSPQHLGLLAVLPSSANPRTRASFPFSLPPPMCLLPLTVAPVVVDDH